jgi:electron transfer flavoprotein alpha subunit
MSVLVVAEQQGGTFKKASGAAIAFARTVSGKQGTTYDILVLGTGAAAAATAAATYGARNVYTVDTGATANYLAQPWSAAIAAVAKESGATWVVETSTTTGKDAMPRVAVKLGAGLAADVIRVEGDGAEVKLIRPMWAGNVLAKLEILTDVKCVTVRGSDWTSAEPTGGASEILASAAGAAAADGAGSKMRFVKFDSSGGNRPELTEADVVVAGGRGLKSEENFNTVMEPLADSLGAAIGASRAAVDSGYAPNDYQIGQTGKSVAPNLYFAVAISGAIQHLAGMKNSKTIVAINKDAEAPIFQVADYGLVADAFKAVPEIIAAVDAEK